MAGGRPSKFDTHVQPHLENGSIRKWILEGKTDVDIARMLGVGHETWKSYMRDREEFSTIVRGYKDLTNDHVESKLYQNATKLKRITVPGLHSALINTLKHLVHLRLRLPCNRSYIVRKVPRILKAIHR
jgi:hypothetical protein